MRHAVRNLYTLVLAASAAASAAAAVPPIVGADQPFAGASDSAKSPNLPSISSPDLAGLAADRLSSGNLAKALAGVKPDAPHATRGAQSVAIYKKFSRSVVLVINDEGLGSGSLIDSRGDVLTNWHVVQGSSVVAVVFKPLQEGRQVSGADARRAEVIKVDELADLALLHVDAVPEGVIPIPLGALKDVEVGADVHAIGHPDGQSWSYTQGVVSQIRRDFTWGYEDKSKHRGTVIQTQTPINPGNSGGPLISDSGTLIGVNSFLSTDAQGINFAVAIDEVARFLADPSRRPAPVAQGGARGDKQCDAPETYRGRNKDDTGGVIGYDLNCTGKTTAEFRYPDDPSLPFTAVFDRNGDGNLDLIIYDFSRTEHWQVSLRDDGYDGSWSLVGHHPDGNLKASWYESYKQYLANGGRSLKK